MYRYSILRQSGGWIIQVINPYGVVDYFYRTHVDGRNDRQASPSPHVFSLEMSADYVARSLLSGYNFERIF